MGHVAIKPWKSILNSQLLLRKSAFNNSPMLSDTYSYRDKTSYVISSTSSGPRV